MFWSFYMCMHWIFWQKNDLECILNNWGIMCNFRKLRFLQKFAEQYAILRNTRLKVAYSRTHILCSVRFQQKTLFMSRIFDPAIFQLKTQNAKTRLQARVLGFFLNKQKRRFYFLSFFSFTVCVSSHTNTHFTNLLLYVFSLHEIIQPTSFYLHRIILTD